MGVYGMLYIAGRIRWVRRAMYSPREENPMENILEIQNLSVVYNESKIAVNRVNMNIPKGSIVAIVGESGSGKSTLIKALIRLLSDNARIATGRALFKGTDLVHCSRRELNQIRGSGISMIFQDTFSTLDPKKRIRYQYVEAIQAHRKVSRAEAEQMAMEMLASVGMPDPQRVMDSYPFELSGGMAQRVAIAMCVSLQSEVILADEPTSALDVTIQAQVVNTLMKLRREHGTTIILVTHNLGVAAYMADYIAVMCHGELVEMDTRDEVIQNPKMPYTKMLIASVPDMEVADFA